MLKVMFLCTGNSCRSQMAEGLARHYGKGILEPYSVGLMPAGVNPRAVRVMKEIGIDISGQTSDPIDEELLRKMDVIITLCGHAEVACLTTPPEIIGTEEEILNAFRKARDEIKERIIKFIQEVRNAQGALEKLLNFRLLPVFVIVSMVIGIAIGKWYGVSNFKLTPPLMP